MQQRLPSLLDDPIAFGHRGARAHAPENTLAGFELALKLGATGLESDVWITADGIPVLDHDGVVKTSLGRNRPIGELQRSALPSHIPSLAELIDRCGTRLPPVARPQGRRPAVRSSSTSSREAAPAMLERLWLCAPAVGDAAALRGQGAKLVDSTRLSRIKEGPERRAATLREHGIDAINMHHSDWNGGHGRPVPPLRTRRRSAGTCKSRTSCRPALRMGLDGVYSDWVDRMIEVYQRRGRPPAESR